MSTLSPEKGPSLPSGPEHNLAIVAQPHLVNYEGFLGGLNTVMENTTEDATSDWTAAGTGGAVATTGGAQTGMSARDQAIANLPIPVVMQKQLENHIRDEVKKLRKQALAIATMSKPGGAYKLNQLYARIRHLNAIMASLFDASVEIIKRIYIRVFVDKQTIQ